jgi:hypothetical protein
MLAGKQSSRRGRSRGQRMSLCTAFMLALLSLWPALAIACPPVLKSVTVPPNGNHPTSEWGLPANVSSQFIQVARSPNVDEFGYFPTVVSFNTLAASQTSFVDQFEFPPGTYYVHVAGHDKRCTGGACPRIEFSDIMTFQVTTPAASSSAVASSLTQRTASSAAISCSDTGPGGGTALPSTTGGPGPDKIAPLQSLSFKPLQDVDRLFVRARMSERGTLTARATVSVSGAAKVYRFKTVTRRVRANVFTKLRLKLVKKRLKAVKGALKKRKRLKAKITVTAKDKAGNKRSQKATIRLTN